MVIIRGFLSLLALRTAVAFTCYPEYSFSWCDNATEASCIHDYAISIGHFQRKLIGYYRHNQRPPLAEAVFLTKLPRPYQEQFIEGGCGAPLILAYLLVAEAKLPMDDDALRFSSIAMGLVEGLSDQVRELLYTSTGSWPFQEAMARFDATARDTEEAQRTFPALLGGPSALVTAEIVVVHCREPLEWLLDDLLQVTPSGVVLSLYEKCGERPALPDELSRHFAAVNIRDCRDPVDGPRGDECLGYLAHIVNHYSDLATFTVFLQADPDQHMWFPFLRNVMAMITKGTYAVPYMSLNGARHTLTYTPCMNAIHSAIFGEPMREPVGPYCCAQFIVQNQQVRERPLEFYQNMLRLVDGSVDYDLCAPGRVARSTHCYGMEFTWHLVFGEQYEPPLRQDDVRLPAGLRLKFGDEFVKKRWHDVVLAPNTPKKIVEEIDYSKMTDGGLR